MATEKLNFDTAFKSVVRLRSIVQPNEGFMEQLRVWEQMEAKLDASHPYVRQRALEALSEQQLTSGSVDREALAVPAEKDAQEVRFSGEAEP